MPISFSSSHSFLYFMESMATDKNVSLPFSGCPIPQCPDYAPQQSNDFLHKNASPGSISSRLWRAMGKKPPHQGRPLSSMDLFLFFHPAFLAPGLGCMRLAICLTNSASGSEDALTAVTDGSMPFSVRAFKASFPKTPWCVSFCGKMFGFSS